MSRSARTTHWSRSGSIAIHIVRRRLGPGIVEPQILAQRQPETTLQRGLDCGDADLAVALHAMAVAAGTQRARHEQRPIELCTRDQLSFIVVTAHSSLVTPGA